MECKKCVGDGVVRNAISGAREVCPDCEGDGTISGGAIRVKPNKPTGHYAKIERMRGMSREDIRQRQLQSLAVGLRNGELTEEDIRKFTNIDPEQLIRMECLLEAQ